MNRERVTVVSLYDRKPGRMREIRLQGPDPLIIQTSAFQRQFKDNAETIQRGDQRYANSVSAGRDKKQIKLNLLSCHRAQ